MQKISDKITLKHISLEDSEGIFDLIDSNRIYLREWLNFVDQTKKASDTKRFVKQAMKDPKSPTFCILYNNELAGLIGFKNTDMLNLRTEIGYWLAEAFQKKGIMIKSVSYLLKYAFNVLMLNRVQIKAAVGNFRSRNIPEKLGFTFEGIEREGEINSDSTFYNVAVHSILKKEYEAKYG